MQTSLVEPVPNVEAALEELRLILRGVAVAGAPPQRLAAVRYVVCRDMLLASQSRARMPGFLHQCASISKFHDFITLYHPSVESRLAFLNEALGESQAPVVLRRIRDAFADEDDF